MPEFKKMLVVGFDGLDYEKIQEYNCDNLMLDSFGKMDTLGLDLKTPQLWASLITGELPEVHGVDDMLVFTGEKARKLTRMMDKILNPLGMAGGGHRDQAFYAVNAEIDGPVTLTNIMEKCLAKVDMPEKEEIEDIEF